MAAPERMEWQPISNSVKPRRSTPSSRTAQRRHSRTWLEVMNSVWSVVALWNALTGVSRVAPFNAITLR